MARPKKNPAASAAPVKTADPIRERYELFTRVAADLKTILDNADSFEIWHPYEIERTHEIITFKANLLKEKIKA